MDVLSYQAFEDIHYYSERLFFLKDVVYLFEGNSYEPSERGAGLAWKVNIYEDIRELAIEYFALTQKFPFDEFISELEVVFSEFPYTIGFYKTEIEVDELRVLRTFDKYGLTFLKTETMDIKIMSYNTRLEYDDC